MSKAQDYFEHVVDRLVEEGRLRAADVDARRIAEGQRSDALTQLTQARRAQAAAEEAAEAYRKGEQAFTALYDAVERAAREIDARESSLETADLLRTTLAAAKKFIDPIPF